MKTNALNLQGWEMDTELQEEERMEGAVMEEYSNYRGPRQMVKL